MKTNVFSIWCVMGKENHFGLRQIWTRVDCIKGCHIASHPMPYASLVLVSLLYFCSVVYTNQILVDGASVNGLCQQGVIWNMCNKDCRKITWCTEIDFYCTLVLFYWQINFFFIINIAAVLQWAGGRILVEGVRGSYLAPDLIYVFFLSS